MSTRPGATILPAQLMTSVPSGTPAAPIPRFRSRMTPSAIRTSQGPSKSREGSITRAFASRIGRQRVRIVLRSRVGQVAGERFQHRHAHRNSHFTLLTDQRLRAVGYEGVDLDAAIHWSGMHDQ